MINPAKAGYSDKWQTPPTLLTSIKEEFGNDLFDPCPITWAPGDQDALTIPWGARAFVNPPYSRVAEFVKKAAEEQAKGCTVVMLINVATDTRWFHEYIYGKPNVEVRFIKGRLKFINAQQPDKVAPAPRPSMLVIFRGQ
jgi:phage N-6-adenine-methyltransferase